MGSMNWRNKTFLKRKNLRAWIILVSIIISLFLFEEVVDDVFFDPQVGDHEASLFDEAVAARMREYRSPRLNQVMTDLTALGSVSVITTLFVILSSVMIFYRDLRGLLYLSIVAFGAGILPPILKGYFARSRPLESNHLVMVTDLSFPSGHSFGATAVYIGLAYYTGQYARSWVHELFFFALGGLLIVLIGTSRVFLGVHYPTDVLAGIAGGMAWSLFVSMIFELHRIYAKNKIKADLLVSGNDLKMPELVQSSRENPDEASNATRLQ